MHFFPARLLTQTAILPGYIADYVLATALISSLTTVRVLTRALSDKFSTMQVKNCHMFES